jgi:hypothetical protein
VYNDINVLRNPPVRLRLPKTGQVVPKSSLSLQAYAWKTIISYIGVKMYMFCKAKP